jgi:hypothetical protein
MSRDLIGGRDIDVLTIKADERWVERDERRFGDPGVDHGRRGGAPLPGPFALVSAGEGKRAVYA